MLLGQGVLRMTEGVTQRLAVGMGMVQVSKWI